MAKLRDVVRELKAAAAAIDAVTAANRRAREASVARVPGGGGGGRGPQPPVPPGVTTAPPAIGTSGTNAATATTSTGGAGGEDGGQGGKGSTVQYGWIDSMTGGPAQLHAVLLELGEAGTYLLPSFGSAREVAGWWLGGHFYPDPTTNALSTISATSEGGGGGGAARGTTPRGYRTHRLSDIKPAGTRLSDVEPAGHRLSDRSSTVSAPGVEAGVAAVVGEVRALRQAVQGDGGATFRLGGGLS